MTPPYKIPNNHCFIVPCSFGETARTSFSHIGVLSLLQRPIETTFSHMKTRKTPEAKPTNEMVDWLIGCLLDWLVGGLDWLVG